ncbi:alkaline phosphatase D family protein [Antrihabitans sp. YC3-6]|uniref:Alkaline phosphatase D family protein n=1 Tax=Antrihabitans stalagmiti TaxID=2799499 RepID=A0A934NTL7_9NOCA|nr:alkaline phosphatase D family protein [Antrihabitans stalagmiti]MBJ8341261.1 alkaline phosphatase D family protein [Antrihabitans stalagmiti]
MSSRTRDRGVARLLGVDRLNIFVPAIMSVGLLFWLASELRELVRATGAASRAKRSAIAGHEVARLTLGSTGAEPPGRQGLRPRPVYLLLAVALGCGAAYVAIGSIANYFRPGYYVADIAWLLALALAASFGAIAYGSVAAVVFVRYPVPPKSFRRMLTNSLLTSRPVDGDTMPEGPSWKLAAGFLAAAAGAGLLALIVAASPHVVDGFDRGVAAWFHGLGWPATSITDLVSRTGIVVVAVVVVGAVAVRCRVLALTFAAAVALGFLATVVLRDIIERPRPLDGPMAGMLDSYPSESVVLAVIVAGLVPRAIATLIGWPRIAAPLSFVLGVATAATMVDRVARGAHWPTDVIGGALIGSALVFGARWVVDVPRAHIGCRSCPRSQDLPLRRKSRGMIRMGISTASAVRVLAHLSAAAVAVTLAVLTFTVGVPTSTENYVFGPGVERPAQLALAGVVSLGALLAWKWEAIGAVLIAFAATCLGIFAAVEYQPIYAVALTAAAMVPSILLWLSWQHRRSAIELVVLAVVTALLLGTTWAGATKVYDIYFGPTHPSSTTPGLAVDRVEWVWSGALSSASISVSARLAESGETASLLVESNDGRFSTTTRAVFADDHRIARMRADGLRPGTRYRFTVVVDGVADTSRGAGSFETPVDGPMSYRVTAGACARVGSNGSVYDAISAERPMIHLALGDLHYGNIEATTPGPYLDAYGKFLTMPAQAALYRAAPIAYVWDDHDYGANDADASSPGRDASRVAFDSAVPHYAFGSPGGTVNQAFTIGRVRFVMTDNRSEATDSTMLGDAQLRWLIDEVTSSSKTHALVVWANPDPWIGESSPGADGWAGHPDERRRIADAIAAAGVHNLISVGGDAHMVAIDDGTNSDYSTTGGAGFPILQAAALDRPGSVKGGPYSEGTYPGGGQYGVLDIHDDGSRVTVSMSGKRWDGTVLTRYEFDVPTG